MPTIAYNNIQYRRWLAFPTADAWEGQSMYYVSMQGFFRPNLRGLSGRRLREQTYELTFLPHDMISKLLPLLPKPANYNTTQFQPVFCLKHWTVFGGLNMIYNRNSANDMRHAVRKFWLGNPAGDPQQVRLYYAGMDPAALNFVLAVQDSDDDLRGVGIRFTGLFAFAGWSRP